MRVTLFCCLLFASVCSFAQSDTLKQVEAALKNGTASVSSILSEKKYLSLHPLTAFRQLIENHASNNVLQIVTNDEPGRKIRVIGSLNDEAGKPLADALIYLYQTDAKGWYAADAPHVLQYEGDVRHARLFGYVKTDKHGQFELHTIKPSGYPQSDLPAHIHVHVAAPGYRSYVTEFLFDDDDRLIGKIRTDAIRSRFLIAKPEKTIPPFEQQFSYRLTIQKQ